jgi:hypothetical protein
MKLSDLFETVGFGVTSVASIGDVEYVNRPSQIKIFKRCNDVNRCIAVVNRNKGDGWRFKPVAGWKDMGLPHIGYLKNIKTTVNGSKTISNNLEAMLKSWGVNYDSLINRER